MAALRLALCDDIGQAAYDGEAVALAFVTLLAGLEPQVAAGVPAGLLEQRYGVPVPVLPASTTVPGSLPDASAWLAAAAERHTSGDTARMAQRLLDEFRKGVLGSIALELPVAGTGAANSLPAVSQSAPPLPHP